MPCEITDYVDVASRATDLGLKLPSGLAILPRNFDSAASPEEFLYESTTPTVRLLWREAGVTETRLESEAARARCIGEKAALWVAPTIFVGALLLTQNPQVVSIAINVISSYLTDMFRGLPVGRDVRLDVVVEKTSRRKCVRVRYEGKLEGLRDVPELVREASQGE